MTKAGNGTGKVRLLFLSRTVNVTSCSIIIERKHFEEKIPTDRFLKHAMWFETNRFSKRNRYLFGSEANEHTLLSKAVKLLRPDRSNVYARSYLSTYCCLFVKGEL